jgi:hypothetical protein
MITSPLVPQHPIASGQRGMAPQGFEEQIEVPSITVKSVLVPPQALEPIENGLPAGHHLGVQLSRTPVLTLHDAFA